MCFARELRLIVKNDETRISEIAPRACRPHLRRGITPAYGRVHTVLTPCTVTPNPVMHTTQPLMVAMLHRAMPTYQLSPGQDADTHATCTRCSLRGWYCGTDPAVPSTACAAHASPESAAASLHASADHQLVGPDQWVAQRAGKLRRKLQPPRPPARRRASAERPPSTSRRQPLSPSLASSTGQA